jgi:Flp pilus assembly protein TadG
LCRRQSRHRGSIAIIAAAGIIAFLGFCALSVDLGRAAATRNKLQRACDAAALAGAQKLPDSPGEARQIARDVASINGAPAVAASDVTFSNNNTTIRVVARQQVNYGFASVFNNRGTTAIGAAVARVDAAAAAPPGVVPIGITPGTFAAHPPGASFTLNIVRQNTDPLGLDQYVLFDLRAPPGKSPAQMEDQIRNGWDEPIRVGDTATTLNAAKVASQGKHFEDAMSDRLASAGADTGTATLATVNPNSPRVMTFIITPAQAQVDGTNEAPVVAFAKVYVQSVSGDGTVLRVFFLGSTFSSDAGSGAGTPGGTSLRTIRLIG